MLTLLLSHPITYVFFAIDLIIKYLKLNHLYYFFKGYTGFVKKLKERIVDGDVIQAVPSQRIARQTGI